MSHKLSDGFRLDLSGDAGRLKPLHRAVLLDPSLCLAIRDGYINIYYRGGVLLLLKGTGAASSGYSASFDERYLPAGQERPELPKRISTKEDASRWVEALPALKTAMDSSGKLQEEREIQQRMAWENNRERGAGETDVYLCDLEHSISGAPDFIGVLWPSTSRGRKSQTGHRLVIGEVKLGDAQFGGKSGLSQHLKRVDAYLGEAGKLAGLKLEMVEVFNQLRSLDLICGVKELHSLGDAKPYFLIVAANHKPASKGLRSALRELPAVHNVDVMVATSSFVGYGLFETGMLTVRQALERLGDE